MTEREPEVLKGYKEIARFLGGLSERQVSYLVKHRQLPVFRLPGGRNLFALPGRVRQWLREHEHEHEQEGISGSN